MASSPLGAFCSADAASLDSSVASVESSAEVRRRSVPPEQHRLLVRSPEPVQPPQPHPPQLPASPEPRQPHPSRRRDPRTRSQVPARQQQLTDHKRTRAGASYFGTHTTPGTVNQRTGALALGLLIKVASVHNGLLGRKAAPPQRCLSPLRVVLYNQDAKRPCTPRFVDANLGLYLRKYKEPPRGHSCPRGGRK